MAQIRQEIEIVAPIDEVFDAIVDLRGYDRWLKGSKAFGGITDISPGPVALGTTWTEPSGSGVRHGTVTRFDPPTQVTFHQPMTLKPRVLGIIDITLGVTLAAVGPTVRVRRLVTIAIPWQLKLLQPFVARQFQVESGRTLSALKRFAEDATKTSEP